MLKAMFSILMLWSGAALSDVDIQFSGGVLGVTWGATLQQVQVAYPGGTAWPQDTENPNGEIVYAVPGDFRVLGVSAPIHLVHFIFTKEKQLQRVFLHFEYSDREAVLYGVARVLGQDYSIRDGTGSKIFSWKPGRSSFAKFETGSGPQFPWAFLAVRAMDSQADVWK